MNKQIVLGVLGLSLLMGVTGCEQKDKAVPAATIETETQPSQAVNPLILKAKVVPAPYQLPDCKGSSCPEINLMQLSSNFPWLDEEVNAEVLKTLQELIDLPALEHIQTETSPTQDHQLQPYVDQLLALDQEIQALGANHQISVMISPKLIQADAPIATVAIVSSSYLGGAHGSSHQEYLNFDLATKRRVQLTELLLQNQRQALEKVAYQAYQDWVKEMQEVNETAEYEQMWPFHVSDNFYLGTQGLVLQYGEYEIGPYVVGLPRLTIPYAQLQGILKSDYLPEQAKPELAKAATK